MDWIAEHFFGPGLQLLLHIAFLFPLIDEHIGILDLLLGIIPSVLSSKGLLTQIINIELPDDSIIELVPLHGGPVLDVRIVVAAIGIPDMHHYSLEDIVVVVIGLDLLLIGCLLALLFAQKLTGVFFEIELLGKFAVIIHL